MAGEAQLKISDGTTTISLIDIGPGIHLNEWTPAIAGYKGGGVFRSNPQTPGRRLVQKVFDNAIETFSLKVNQLKRNILIFQMQEVLRLLEKATDYWAADWQNEVVYLIAQAECEDNPRYAEIVTYSIPQLDNPYGQPFLSVDGNAVFDNITLGIERKHWKTNIPGNGTAVEISGTQDYDSRTLGRTATTNIGNVFIANGHNIANISDVYRYDDSLASFSSNLMDAAVPFNLFPSPAGDEDILYIGIDTSLTDSGPFDNVVFDIGTAAAGTHTIIWEYYNGVGWVTILDFTDWTDDSSGPFTNTGVRSFHFDPPSNWSTLSVNGVTGYWIRARIDIFTSMTSVPTQQNRLIYSAILPYVNIDSAQVLGDIPSLSRINVTQRGNEQENFWTLAGGFGAVTRWQSRLITGLRSRETGFTAYINFSDEQHQDGIDTVLALSLSSIYADDITTPTGRRVEFQPPKALSFAKAVTIRLDTTVMQDFYGAYHAFVRARQVNGDTGDMTMRLKVLSRYSPVLFGSSNVLTVTPAKSVLVIDDWQLVDMGRLEITPPALFNSGSDLTNYIIIDVEVTTTSGTPDLYLCDLILIPVDEWSADTYSIDTGIGNYVPEKDLTIPVGRFDIDSVTWPKPNIRTLIRGDSQDGDDNIIFTPSLVSNGRAILQSNVTQRLWFLLAHPQVITGSHTGGSGASTLTDATADFINEGVKVGQTIINLSAGSHATITGVTATTISGTLVGGVIDDDWDNGDQYYITTDEWIASPSLSSAIELYKNEQYLGMRGSR